VAYVKMQKNTKKLTRSKFIVKCDLNMTHRHIQRETAFDQLYY